MHDSVRLEEKGVPTVPLATDEFRTAARVQASRLGRPDLDAVFVPHPIQDRTDDEVRDAWLAMVPEGRLGRPEELGAAIAFLASPAAAYIRGVNLPVDGGRLNSI